MTSNLKQALTELATEFRRQYKLAVGIAYEGSISIQTSSKRFKNYQNVKRFLNLLEKYSISSTEYFQWFFTYKLPRINTANFFLVISSSMFNDFLIYRQLKATNCRALLDKRAKNEL